MRFTGFLVCFLISFLSFAQNKVAVSIANPSSIHICIESDYLEVEVRNIVTTTVTGVQVQVDLPDYVNYVAGSLSTVGASEQNISNLNTPLFSLPDITIASAVKLRIKILANCDLIGFVNGGGLARSTANVTYAGGTASVTSGPLSVRQPSLSISSITNQLASANKNTYVIRTITLKNNGSGKLRAVALNRYIQSGVDFIGSSETYTINPAGSFATTILDSNDIQRLTGGTGDGFLDLNETVSIIDTILVRECSNLGLTYEAVWGCEGKICKKYSSSTNVSIKSANPNLVFTPVAETNVCLSNADSLSQKLIIYNSGVDTARNIDLDIFNSASTGYYQYVITEMLTGTFTYRISSRWGK